MRATPGRGQATLKPSKFIRAVSFLFSSALSLSCKRGEDDVLLLTHVRLDRHLHPGQTFKPGRARIVDLLEIIETLLDLGIVLLTELVGIGDIAEGAESTVDHVLLLNGVLAKRMLEREQQSLAFAGIPLRWSPPTPR